MSKNIKVRDYFALNTINPPIFGSSYNCSGIYKCKRKQYEDWLGDIRGKKYPLFLCEIGSQSSEFSASGNGGGFAGKW